MALNIKNGILLVLLLYNYSVFCQTDTSSDQNSKSFSIAFYNVENLFDTINDPDINDEDFLPESRIQWNSKRYLHKLENTSKVLSSVNNNNPPDVIGLSEVENKKVLEELVISGGLQNCNYQIVHENSSDERGIDVALLYKPDKFNYISHSTIEITFPFDTEDKTREILYVTGLVAQLDTIHFFINHWPSRRGGKEASQPKREYVAKILKNAVDSLFRINQNSNVIIMGDLNDEPADSSINHILGAKAPGQNIERGALYNLCFTMYSQGLGTIYWKDWDLFDHIIISSNLITKKNGLVISTPEAIIYKPQWLLYKNVSSEMVPSRTAGREYYGGFSDHLLVYVLFRIL